MIHGCVTLDEVFAAAAVRAASLVPETSGYLALAVGDATSRLPFAIDDRMVILTTEGNVGITKRGEVLPPRQAAAGLRDVLTRLLAVSTGTAMPALAAAGRPRDESDRGVDSVVEEIEAALIPVNRAAARRALARLSRETIRAKEAGKIKPRPSARPPAEAAKVETPRVETAKVETPRVETPRVEAPRVETAKVEAPRVETARVETPRPETPEVVVAPVEIANLEPPRAPAPAQDPTAQLAVGATTPPPLEVIHLTSSAPVVFLPTPPPVPVSVLYPELTPAPVLVEATPTLLGMGAMEVEGPPPEIEIVHPRETETATPAPDSEEAVTHALPVEPAPTASPSPSPLTEPFVMAQPTEAPELAFELVNRGPRVVPEAITPPFHVEVEQAPRSMPIAWATSGVDSAPRPAPAPTRADDLLARFGASCADERGMAEAAACLRRMAGVDATPPPSRAEEPSEPVTELRHPRRAAEPIDLETPLPPSARRRSRSLGSVGVTLGVLLIGIAGGGALVKLRPDLFGALGAAPAPRPPVTRAEPKPAPTAEPQGAVSPGWAPSGGPRAERGAAAERSR